MPASALSAVIRRAGANPGEPDAALLARFTASADHAAFAELVRRHARLVWSACRQSLPGPADADDAFQATFLALARHAGSVRDPHRLGPWLHTVAVRVCRNARRAAARRSKREARAAVPERAVPVPDSAWDAAATVVHEEVARLPAAHRVVFVLCVLEGRTPTAVAAQLGVPVGTVGARLHRAKEHLLKRLAARGLGAAVALATLLEPPASATERAAALAPSAAILSLLPGAVPMSLPHAKLLLVLVALAVGLTGLLLPTAAHEPPRAPQPKADKPAAKLDLHGDPLPEKAAMRLGTVRYRIPDLAGVGFKKTGELVALSGRLELHTFPADGSPTATVIPLEATTRKYTVSWAAISADARFAAAPLPDDTKPKLVVWDISGAKPVEHTTLDIRFANRLTFSIDGRWLVVCDEDRDAAVPVQLCDLATKKWTPVGVPPRSGSVEHAAFNADGSRLVVTISDTAHVFDPDSGELLLKAPLPRARLEAAAVSPDGKALALLRGSWVFGPETEIPILKVTDAGSIPGWTNPKVKARNVGFTPDGKTLWVLGGGTLREWDPAAAKWVRETAVPLDEMYAHSPVWAPDGKRFAGYNRHTVALMDAARWKPLHADALAAGPLDTIFGVTVSPDGKTVATDGNDVHLWDAATGKLLATVKAAWGNSPMLVFRPDSKSFITVVDLYIPAEFDARTGKELRRFDVPKELVKKVSLRDLHLSADGKTLTAFASSVNAADPSVRVRWDVAKGEVTGQAATDAQERFEELSLGRRSPDGEWTANSGSVGRADNSEKPVVVFPPAERSFSGPTAWAADSKRVALPRAVGKTPEEKEKPENCTLVVFDMTTQTQLTELPAGRVVRSAFSADGRRVATMTKSKVAVWDVASGKEVFSAAADAGNTIIARGITFTPDGRRLFTTHGTHALAWDLPAR